MKIIFYSKDAQFELTEEEYEKSLPVWNEGRKCFIQRLNASLSPLYIWAGEKPSNNTVKKNRDSQLCIQKFGQWYLESDQSVRVDTRYYPELLEQPIKNEAVSNFSKDTNIKSIQGALS